MADQYLDYIRPVLAGASLEAQRANRIDMEERRKLAVQQLLEEQMQRRAIEEYRNKALAIQQAEETRRAQEFAMALDREKKFGQVYNEHMATLSDTVPTWQGGVSVPRTPTWRDQYDAMNAGLIASGQYRDAANLMAGRGREELAAMQNNFRMQLSDTQAANRMELEKAKADWAMERAKANNARDPRLGYFNIIDPLMGTSKGRVYFNSLEERDAWMKNNGGVILKREGEDGTDDTSTGAEGGQYEPEKELTREQALKFYNQAGGNADKARELARKAGYVF